MRAYLLHFARRYRQAGREPAYLLADATAPRNQEADRLFAEVDAMGGMGPRQALAADPDLGREAG